MRTLEQQLELACAALAAFGDSVRFLGRAMRYFAFQLRLGMATTKSEKHRVVRDWQRLNRRPALIHNGRKPRRK